MIITFCEEKTQDTIGMREYMAAICHKNLLFCPIGVVPIELFWHFEISEEKPSDFNKRGIWYH